MTLLLEAKKCHLQGRNHPKEDTNFFPSCPFPFSVTPRRRQSLKEQDFSSAWSGV